MTTESKPHRMLFTFRGNGVEGQRRLVEITAEHLAIHEAPASVEAAHKHSWFGDESDVADTLATIRFPALDIEGVLSSLHVNKVATREIETSEEELTSAGFAPSA